MLVLTESPGEIERGHHGLEQESPSKFGRSLCARFFAHAVLGDQCAEHERRIGRPDVQELPIKRALSSRRYGHERRVRCTQC